MFEDIQKRCNKIVRDYIDKAILERENMTEDIKENKLFTDHQKVLEFFDAHSLLNNSKERQT